jgi:hypothetical protein
VLAAAPAFAESPGAGTLPATTSNPNNASNPAGAPLPPKQWQMRPDQKAHRGECRKLTKQIARYDRDAGWAKERGNELWEYSSRERLYRLAAEREKLCPSVKGPTTEELLADAALMAAKLAAAAYTQGAL